MDQLKLAWTATALKQRDYIFEFWNERNKNFEYSKKLNKQIHERMKQLKSHPKLGKRTTFSNTGTFSLGAL